MHRAQTVCAHAFLNCPKRARGPMNRFHILFVWQGQPYRVQLLAKTIHDAAQWLEARYPDVERAEFQRVDPA